MYKYAEIYYFYIFVCSDGNTRFFEKIRVQKFLIFHSVTLDLGNWKLIWRSSSTLVNNIWFDWPRFDSFSRLKNFSIHTPLISISPIQQNPPIHSFIRSLKTANNCSKANKLAAFSFWADMNNGRLCVFTHHNKNTRSGP